MPLEMDDGTRIAILLPAGMVPGSVQVDAGSDSAELEGPDFDAVLAYEFCPGDVQDAGSLNGNGALVAVLADRLVICRPDQMLRLDIETSEPSDHSSESFDIVPMDLGESYLATIEANDQAPICCDAFGPLPVDSLMITANRFTSGRITAWNSETLVPEWTTSIGESSLLLGAWEGVVVATPGRGQIFGLDAGNGQTLWQLALSQYEEVVGAGHESGDNVWYISSEFPIEGETAAPRVRSLDVETGQVLWTAQGRPETLLQWVDPAVFTDVVVMMDVPRFVPDQDIATTSHLLAYDKETGEQIWSVDLEDPTEAFSDRLLASDSSNEILIAATPSGEVFSLDPASGQILWRTETGFARITDLNNSTVRLQQGSAEIELDVNTGQPINK
ncbi:MAG: PQQ-binding-like beta-propeller repeat protein [Acidimicrobiia bacterium]